MDLFKKSFTLSIILVFLTNCEKEKEKPTTINSEMEVEVLILINNYRDSIGLKDLIINDKIREISREHSKDMALGVIDVGHDGFETRYETLLKELGNGGAAENVAVGYKTARAVVEAWLSSPNHKNNIDGDYELSGVGIVGDENNYYYFTHIFFNPLN